MFLPDSRKCLEIEMRPGARPKKRCEAWSCHQWALRKAAERGTGREGYLPLLGALSGETHPTWTRSRRKVCKVWVGETRQPNRSKTSPALHPELPQKARKKRIPQTPHRKSLLLKWKKKNNWMNDKRVEEKAGNKKVVAPDRAQLPALSTSWGAACSSARACSMASRKSKSPPVSQRLPTWAGLTSHLVVTDDPSGSPDSSRLTLDPAWRPRK